MARRAAARPIVRPVEPPLPKREPFVPTWYQRRWHDVHTTTKRCATVLRDIEAGFLRIPPFQRPWVWTDEQILHLLDSLRQGYHTGTILLWERVGLPPSRESFGEVSVDATDNRALLVIDGQQRLGAFATAVRSGRFYFDMETGGFHTDGPRAWSAPMDMLVGAAVMARLDWVRDHAIEHDLDESKVFDAWCAAYDVMDAGMFTFTVLPQDWTAERVVETFRRMNTAGTRMAPEELAMALEGYEER